MPNVQNTIFGIFFIFKVRQTFRAHWSMSCFSLNVVSHFRLSWDKEVQRPSETEQLPLCAKPTSSCRTLALFPLHSFIHENIIQNAITWWQSTKNWPLILVQIFWKFLTFTALPFKWKLMEVNQVSWKCSIEHLPWQRQILAGSRLKAALQFLHTHHPWDAEEENLQVNK